MKFKSQFGLTTLIVFISLIVTAAVAAGVIIYTTQSMQQQALQTGAEAKQKISTGLEVIRMLGYQFNGTNLDTGYQKISILAPFVRLMTGSPPIKMTDLTFILSTDTGDFYSISLQSSKVPIAFHGILEGTKILLTGFMTNRGVNLQNVSFISDKDLTNQEGNITIICSNIGNSTYNCTMSLNNTVYNKLLSDVEVFRLMEEAKDDLGTDSYFLFLALNIKNNNLYIEDGEIYEIAQLLNNPLPPNTNYDLQIIPKNGYATNIKGRIPSALSTPVIDIYFG